MRLVVATVAVVEVGFDLLDLNLVDLYHRLPILRLEIPPHPLPVPGLLVVAHIRELSELIHISESLG